LILDVQRCVRELVSEELRFEGYKTCDVGNPKQLQEKLVRFQPDIVILDLFLDGTDGFSELQYIKWRYPDLPVIIFTAYNNFRDDPRLFQADSYVSKSLDLTELKREIANILAHRGVSERRCRNTYFVETCNTLLA